MRLRGLESAHPYSVPENSEADDDTLAVPFPAGGQSLSVMPVSCYAIKGLMERSTVCSVVCVQYMLVVLTHIGVGKSFMLTNPYSP